MNRTGPATPRGRPGTGLQARLALVLIVAVTPGVVLALLEADRSRDRARADAEHKVRELATLAVSTQERLVDESRALLTMLASVPEVRDHVPGRCDEILAELLADSPAFVGFGVATLEGQVTCSSAPLIEPLSVADRPYFSRALEEGGFVLGEYQVAVLTGAQTLPAARPVLDDGGETVGVVIAGIDLGWAADLFDEAALPERSALALIDSQGTVLVRVPGGEKYVGRTAIETPVVRAVLARGGEGLITAVGLDGKERLYAYAPLGAPGGGHVYAGIPTAVAFGDAEARFQTTVVALTVAGALTFAAALLLARFTVLARLRRVVSTARRLAGGDRTARSGLRGPGEVAAVGTALDDLADALDRREEALRSTAAALVSAQEEERARMATDVHDDSVQVMTAHLLGLQLLHRRLAGSEHEVRVAELEHSAAGAIDRLRHLIFELHSPVLTEHGLAAALHALLASTFAGSTTAWRVDDSLPGEPSVETATVAYRIAQEALANARRHAAARHVEVGLRRADDALVLTVSDDGVGFSPPALDERPGHRGLAGMSDRATLAGGEVRVGPRPEGGTLVDLRLPWDLGAVFPEAHADFSSNP